MKAGPKARVDDSPLPWNPRSTGAKRFAKFCEKFIVTPKGFGAKKPMKLRDWQIELVGSVLDADPMPVEAGWMMPRGQGKSSLLAALGLYDLFEGQEGASVVVAAVDERQAKIIFNTAVRMVELNEDLSSRANTYKDKITVPARGATFQVLPATPKSLEGLDPSLALVDEIGEVNPDVWHTILDAQGKRESSTMIGIGTPGRDPHSGVLASLRDYHRANPEDTSLVWREFSAAGFEDHPVDCAHCLELANPALDDFLKRQTILSQLPPKTPESRFRRVRLCQFITETSGAFLPMGVWDSLNTGEQISEGEDVVLALDGSTSGDSTAVVIARVGLEPHFDVLGLWEPNEHDEDYRVPVLDVEDAILEACKRYNVKEVTADPFLWNRSLQVLEKAGARVVEFPWSNHRIGPATSDFYQGCVNGQVTHSGDPRMAAHVGNAVTKEIDRGMKIDKSKRNSTRHIDIAAACVMAHSRAQWQVMKKKKRKARSFRR